MIQCPECHRENPSDNLLCDYCGALLDPLQKTPKIHIDDLRLYQTAWGNARVSSRHYLILRIVGTNDQFRMPLEEHYPVIVGRYDPLTNPAPQVDLADFNEKSRGISRLHASVMVEEGLVYVTDLGSTNGTYINGKRLQPQEPALLRDGDELRLGELKMAVVFVEMPDRSRSSEA